MSADNYYLIRPHKGKWAVTMEFASCDIRPLSVNDGASIFDTREEARDYAFDCDSRDPAEYGVTERFAQSAGGDESHAD